MKRQLTLIVCLCFVLNCLNAHMMHRNSALEQEWKEDKLPPFNEFMLSWNASRPVKGKLLFYVSAKIAEWSPWILYASWEHDGQSSFSNTAQNVPIKVFQDALEVLDGKKATGFQIKVIAEGGASLENLYALHVYTNGDRDQSSQRLSYPSSVELEVPGLSQMTVNHMRYQDLCSPTSTTAVTRYLSHDKTIDPANFAEAVWDRGFDIFGNWVLNVAEASAKLGPEWSCWVERLNSFDAIYQRLQQGTPVIVSVKGPLPGSALPYAKGHLMVITGYDATHQRVICMDPAFPSDEETHVSYAFTDFVEARSRRGNVAYVFCRKKKI